MRIRSFYIKRRSEYRHARRVGGGGHGFRGNMSDYHGAVLAAEERRGEESGGFEKWWRMKRKAGDRSGGEVSITLCHGQLCLVGWLCPSHFPSLTPISWHCLTHSGPLSTGRQKERDQLANQPWQFISLQGLGDWGRYGPAGTEVGMGVFRIVDLRAVILIHWFTNVELEESFFFYFLKGWISRLRLGFKVKVKLLTLSGL